MIAKLKGRVDLIDEDSAIIDVGGVGYLVFCSAKTLAGLPAVGEACEVMVETHVREDHIHLYGFATAAEKAAFKLLTGVQGVGAKVGLAILSALSPQEMQAAVASGDKAPFTRASGVGPKLAQRLVTELADKVGALIGGGAVLKAVAGTADRSDTGAVEEAVSALTNLGYGRMDAFSAVTQEAANDPEAPVEDLIKRGLKVLSANV